MICMSSAEFKVFQDAVIERDALLAQLASGQEPAAFCQTNDPDHATAFSWPGTSASQLHTTPLYAHPAPAQPIASGQEPRAWETFDGEGGYDLCQFAENESYREDYIKRNGEKYASWVVPLYAPPAPAQQPIASRQESVSETIKTVIGCFEAAYSEGLSEALAETKDERLKDLFERRIVHALYAAQAQPIASGQEPRKIPIPPPGADPFDITHAEGWNACCDAFFGGVAPLDPVVITITEAPAQQPLTLRQLSQATHGFGHVRSDYMIGIARAIEAAHNIKEKP
jgi:hypothetical protein